MIWEGNYGVAIDISIEDAEQCSHMGDCAMDVNALMREPYIRKQLDGVDVEKLKKELKDYGAWSDQELDDHKANLQRILWLACGNIVEENLDRA
jgi:hypothetical protein